MVEDLGIIIDRRPNEKLHKRESQTIEKIGCVYFNSQPLAQKIITLREELGGFKEPQALIQLPELTTLDWEEWEEQGIIIIVD